jgi:hypothetical protein
VLLGAVASTTQYSMLGTDVDKSDVIIMNNTFNSENEIKMMVSVIMTSIMTILAAIVQFFRFHEQSEKHRETAIEYSEISNRITQIKYGGPDKLERPFLNEIADIDKYYPHIKSNAPMISDSLIKNCDCNGLENGNNYRDCIVQAEDFMQRFLQMYQARNRKVKHGCTNNID